MELKSLFSLVLVLVMTVFVNGAQAFDAGDGIMLFLGLVLGILGIFAILGCVARRSGSS